jgi:hypothetical protein
VGSKRQPVHMQYRVSRLLWNSQFVNDKTFLLSGVIAVAVLLFYVFITEATHFLFKTKLLFCPKHFGAKCVVNCFYRIVLVPRNCPL